ncbi:thiopurine S-methyltransferase [Ancylobacter sp. SL191]|uniref:thiopurine S-methyltransferase n=1 Tax=Ancylobacter sp. SL191 TaxID=2995166 RepID=UPI00226F8A09|nr:thiopurine S-methyltransferase [Ancylobacter sp. SL191]WAC25536.1 thiopurine S-methyltransferase [Ancylobacter sp. SL191]
MNEEFWHGRWHNNQIGFHESEPNPLLLKHFRALDVAEDGRVFVPLCGKSHDIGWLMAQGHPVVGAELSRLAVEALFHQLGLTPAITPLGPLERFEAAGLTVFVGNLFDLDRHALGIVDAIYDRAALVALPDHMRAGYAAHLIHLTHAAPQLLITFEYDPSLAIGPPFSVDAHEVRRHYGATYRLVEAAREPTKGGVKGHPAHDGVWLMHRR